MNIAKYFFELDRKRWLLLAVIVAIAVALGVFFLSSFFSEALDEAIAWTEDLMSTYPLAGAIAFFLFSILSAMLAFASSVVLVPPANLVWGEWISFLLLWGGWLAGSAAAYWIGHGMARSVLTRFISKEKLLEYERFVGKGMNFWTALLVCLAVPSEIPGYLFGSARYPFWRFLLAIGIAEALYAVAVVLAGDRLLAREPLPLFALGAAVIALAAGAGIFLRRLYRHRRRQKPTLSTTLLKR